MRRIEHVGVVANYLASKASTVGESESGETQITGGAREKDGVSLGTPDSLGTRGTRWVSEKYLECQSNIFYLFYSILQHLQFIIKVQLISVNDVERSRQVAALEPVHKFIISFFFREIQ